jgi:hypothetical protein
VDDFEQIIDLVESVRDEEIAAMEKFEEDDISSEILELFGLLNIGPEDSIENYIEMRYNIILSLLEGEMIEQINKKSR